MRKEIRNEGIYITDKEKVLRKLLKDFLTSIISSPTLMTPKNLLFGFDGVKKTLGRLHQGFCAKKIVK